MTQDIIRRTKFGSPIYVLGHPIDVAVKRTAAYLQPYVLYETPELLQEMEDKGVLMFTTEREARDKRTLLGLSRSMEAPASGKGAMVQLDERTQHGTLLVLSRVRKINTIYVV